MSTIALFGAGGKMGCRILDNLRKTEHRVLCIEVAPAGLENLASRGYAAVAQAEALDRAEVVVLALPDRVIGPVTRAFVPSLRAGTMLILLDPAAAYAGELPERADITYMVTHPCHPPVFNDETDPAARRDFFGGVLAKQHIVCALMQGPEVDYERGAAICRQLFAPVMEVYRCTVEQMAILEPALSETTTATCLTIIREALDEAVRRGVPRDAARAFLLGHINIELAVIFGEAGNPLSDGALVAIERARPEIFQPDWKKVFEPEQLRRSVEAIVHPDR